MIKALVIFHVWSLVLGIFAWFLQRDRAIVGESFPRPGVWMGLIYLCIFSACFSLVPISNAPSQISLSAETLMLDRIPENVEISTLVFSINFLWVYAALAGFFLSQTIWKWVHLQRLVIKPTRHKDVFLTDFSPPLTLSWPRRAILLPQALLDSDSLIKHERTHLRHYDAEMTVLLLLLRDISLRAPGISYLIRQWRLAIELRADHAVTKNMTKIEKQDYARLLLDEMKPAAFKKDGGALPCPTAHLTSTRYRSVKMRLHRIIDSDPRARKARWDFGILAAALATVIIGGASITANANDFADVKYVKRGPPKLPAKCIGLDTDTIKITGKKLNFGGQETFQHFMEVGRVKLRYDIERDGSLKNISVMDTNHDCFSEHAIESLSKWKAEPQSDDLKNVEVMISFRVNGENHSKLEEFLAEFLR